MTCHYTHNILGVHIVYSNSSQSLPTTNQLNPLLSLIDQCNEDDSYWVENEIEEEDTGSTETQFTISMSNNIVEHSYIEIEDYEVFKANVSILKLFTPQEILLSEEDSESDYDWNDFLFNTF